MKQFRVSGFEFRDSLVEILWLKKVFSLAAEPSSHSEILCGFEGRAAALADDGRAVTAHQRLVHFLGALRTVERRYVAGFSLGHRRGKGSTRAGGRRAGKLG